jgi:hypothetical protein
MSQPADIRPDPTYQRKAAVALGGAADHTHAVEVAVVPDFDLDRTIFRTLGGKAARFVMKNRIGKEVSWKDAAAKKIQAAYDDARAERPLPEVSPELLRFLVDECDFDVEHADGSFLDHLYFCFEYGAQHYPQRSALVLLLHSILGTGTNTFAMPASKIPALRELMTPFEWTHVEAFPSLLRLLYAGKLRAELRANLHRIDRLESVSMFRVIDGAPITLSAEDFWIAQNYQLIHLVDFLPVANWAVHQNDTAFIIFRDLYDLMTRASTLEAKLDYTPARGPRKLVGENLGVGGWLTTLIPVGVSELMAAKSVETFSERIGHSLGYELSFRA